MAMKSLIYRAGLKMLKLYWLISGGRRITAFGEKFLLAGNSVFPHYRKLRLPKGGYGSDIVRYCDFVQIHAMCKYVAGLSEKPLLIDIGAYHGAYAIVLGKIVQRKGGRVLAVEPNPASFKVLLENVRLNGLEDTVACEQIAVLDKLGPANIKFQGSESYVTKNHTDSNVEVTTLGILMDKYEIKRVDLLIIDVEGAELPVLRGFPWETAGADRIFCELHPYAWKNFGYTRENMTEFLNDQGYRCLDMYFTEYTSFDSDSYIGPTFLCKCNS